jgi:hypothetical protein
MVMGVSPENPVFRGSPTVRAKRCLMVNAFVSFFVIARVVGAFKSQKERTSF